MLVSCDKSDSIDIQGDWNVESFSVSGSTITVSNANTSTLTYESTSTASSMILHFGKDKQLSSSGSIKLHVLNNNNGTESESDYDINEFAYTGEWSQNGDTISIDKDGEISKLIITDFSKDKLTLTYSEGTEQAIFGTKITYSAQGTIQLTK